MDPRFLRHAARDLPRYTSYPTAPAFHDGVGPAEALAWAAAAEPGAPISVYVHVPFCYQLCWYCGCRTTVPNGYARVEAFARRLEREIDLWAEALGAHGGAARLHFGGGSPNALGPADFAAVTVRLRSAFRLRPDAEVAVELDPRTLTDAFVDALGEAGVTRASLGVQTFDARVQAAVNRIQPYEDVGASVARLRAAGVRGINFDLMYGLPLQDEASVAETARLAADLAPDRVAVFGYAHVPWFAKHQVMIRESDLAGVEGRWAQADAAEAVLTGAGYAALGLDHFARPDDSLAEAWRSGRLKRNFQGYTTDAAETLVPLGPSAIGRFREGYAANAKSTADWGAAVESGRPAVDRGLVLTDEDRLRAEAIERLMCDGRLDVAALCAARGFSEDALDDGLHAARALEADGLCRVDGRSVAVAPAAARLVRALAAGFDARLTPAPRRHAKAV